MNKLSVLVTLFLLGSIGLALWLRRPDAPPDVASGPPPVLLQDGTLVVTGSDVSLKGIESAISDPTIFHYDAERKAYVCNASLDVQGSLQIGRPGLPESGEILEMQTFACGDRAIRVRPGGTLGIYHSEIATMHRSFDEKLCTKGYAIIGEGTLKFDTARIMFMSGSVARPTKRGARGRFTNCQFIETDGNSFFAEDVDGEVIEIRDCEFISRGNYGFIISGPGTNPLRLVRCKLRGAAGDFHHAGQDADAVLVDCDFRKETISFNQLNGSVIVQWAVRVNVMGPDGKPRPGVTVHAASDPDCGLEEEVSAATDENGQADLILTEFVANPFTPKRLDGINNRTPHRVQVLNSSGRPLAEETKIEASKAGLVITVQSDAGN